MAFRNSGLDAAGSRNPDAGRTDRATRMPADAPVDAPAEPYGEWYLESLWDDLADDAEYISAIGQRFNVD